MPDEPINWTPLRTLEAWSMARRLRHELKKGHVLHGKPFRVIARNPAHDDVLLALPATGQWAAVHMTWQGGQEPPFPFTVIVDRLQDLPSEL